jgi:hypothetical protein
MFDSPGVFYSDDPKIIFNDNWLLDQSKIVSLKNHNLVILNFSSEHYGLSGIDHVYHALKNSGINFLLLTHDPADHKKFDRLVFYPHWYHWSRKNFIVKQYNIDTRTYKWSCLNGNPRAHRIYNYYYSKQQPYYDSSYFTFYNAEPHRGDDVILPSIVKDFWESIRHTMPSRDNINIGPRPDSVCNLPAISDSYIHLVTETTVISKIFVSEKTWKPIATGQLFLVFGNPGTISYLRDSGVDVFDDIIDHSYDLINNWQDRLHAIHYQLRHLLSQDLNAMYIDTKPRRTNNVDKFFSGAFDNLYKLEIEKTIKNIVVGYSGASK